jgi:hypothetical protein
VITPEDAKLVETGVKAATSEALRPFTDLISKLFGPSADQIGLGLAAGWRAWRLKREIRFWQVEQKLIAKGGFEPSAVPPKILLPIIQNACLEDDDDLQDRWAALLANAANPSPNMTILPGFLDALRQLSPHEAAFLDTLCPEPIPKHRVFSLSHLWIQDIKNAWESATKGISEDLLQLAFDNLARLGFFRTGMELSSVQPGTISSLTQFTDLTKANWITSYELTDFGRQFLLACRAPAAKSDTEVNLQ